MANRFLEDPNSLGNVVNGWNPSNIVVNRATISNAFITNETVTNLTGTNISFTNQNITNLKFINATGTYLSINNLTGSSMTATNLSVVNQLNIASGSNGFVLTSDSNGNASWQAGRSNAVAFEMLSTAKVLNASDSGKTIELLSGGTPYNITLPNVALTGVNFTFLAGSNFNNNGNPTIVGSSLSIHLNQAFVATGAPFNCSTTPITNIQFNTGPASTPGSAGVLGGETVYIVSDGSSFWAQANLTRATNITVS